MDFHAEPGSIWDGKVVHQKSLPAGALTKEIIHLHKGTIRACNVDGGAVFEITLPMGR